VAVIVPGGHGRAAYSGYELFGSTVRLDTAGQRGEARDWFSMTDAADASRQASGSSVAAATVEQGRPFVGRVQELRELRAALQEAATGRGTCCWSPASQGSASPA
jgi:hypothetical protein